MSQHSLTKTFFNMNFSSLFALLLSPFAIGAYNPLKPSALSMKGKYTSLHKIHFVSDDTIEHVALAPPESFSDINLTTLLESTPRNSEVYTQAMISLQNLQGESFCHKLAVQLLMNNCKDIKEISDQGLPFKHDTHKLQVEGFITGLTLCVLGRGEFIISDSCTPFTASALLRAHQRRERKLDFSREQNDACVAALSRDPSQWTTWLSQQREALTICRAVRLDIEKGEGF